MPPPYLMNHPRAPPITHAPSPQSPSIHRSALIHASIHLLLLFERDDATIYLPPTIQTAVQDHVCHSLWSAKNNDKFLPLTLVPAHASTHLRPCPPSHLPGHMGRRHSGSHEIPSEIRHNIRRQIPSGGSTRPIEIYSSRRETL